MPCFGNFLTYQTFCSFLNLLLVTFKIITKQVQRPLQEMTSWLVIAEATLIKDVLRILKQLSLFFQADTSTVVTAPARIEFAKSKLLALKSHCGKSEEKFLASFGSDMTYKEVPISKSDSDEARFKSLKAQFCQAILDNLEQRFPGTTFLNAAKVLDPASWPNDPVV